MSVFDEIDIVILNCNNNTYIQNCIDSIRANTEEPYNLIIVDQNSKDNSKEWLIENVNHIILNKRNVGAGEGYNQGIRAGKSNWIALIDSDIIIKDKFWLDKMWNYTLDRKIGLIETKTWNNSDKKFEFSYCSFCMIRRQCFNEIGSFDKQIIYGSEFDWIARLEYSWWKTAYCVDTNILHYSELTINSFGKAAKLKLKNDCRNILKYKYSHEFLNNTLFKHIRRKIMTEIEQGW